MEDFEVNRSNESKDEALSQINDLLIDDSSSSVHTIDQHAGCFLGFSSLLQSIEIRFMFVEQF